MVGERKAVAAAILALYTLIYLINSLIPPDESLRALFSAMSAMYGTAFFAVVAGYFWARWFAIGVGLYGFIGGVMAMFQIGVDYPILFFGGTHGLISLLLWGDKMATDFDGRPEWRARYHMDDGAVRRLGKAVIRVGISLPILLAYCLAPRDGTAETLLVLSALVISGLGIWGLARLRTWGILAMAGGAALVLGSLGITERFAALGKGMTLDLGITGLMAGLILLAATLPFARPMLRALRK